MSKEQKPLNEGYRPQNTENKGYQPSPASQQPDGVVQGGYQPISQGGTSTTSPPGKE